MTLEQVKTWTVRVNGAECAFEGVIEQPKPNSDAPIYGFSIPLSALLRGYNLVEVNTKHQARIVWVEAAF